jgi:hypothetical protein
VLCLLFHIVWCLVKEQLTLLGFDKLQQRLRFPWTLCPTRLAVGDGLLCRMNEVSGSSTGWSKSHATHIKIFIDGCNSVQLDWINKHTLSLWLYKSLRTSCRNLLAPVRQLFFNSRSARMSFSQVQRVFIVEHYLTSRSYSSCQNEFRDTFPILLCQTCRQYLVWWTVSVTAEALHRVASNMRKRVNARIAERGGHFQHLI